MSVDRIDYWFDALRTLDTIVPHVPPAQRRIMITSINENDSVLAGVGSVAAGLLPDEKVDTSKYQTLNKVFKGTYVEWVVDTVRAHARNTYRGALEIGRVRYMVTNPLTCYDYHVDPEQLRFHIPLKTSPKSFFIVQGETFQMSVEGRLYSLRTDRPHTAINAHPTKERAHLVFDTFSPK